MVEHIRKELVVSRCYEPLATTTLIYHCLIMGLWESFCGDTSLHGYQYIARFDWLEVYSCHLIIYHYCFLPRRERQPFWAMIILMSISFAVYFVAYNTNEYLQSFTVTNLKSTTSSLDNIYFPSVTVCNMNQIRFVHEKMILLISVSEIKIKVTFLWFCRESFWLSINVTQNNYRKDILNYFIKGKSTSFSKNELSKSKEMLDSPQFQSEFCDYLIHTGNNVYSVLNYILILTSWTRSI